MDAMPKRDGAGSVLPGLTILVLLVAGVGFWLLLQGSTGPQRMAAMQERVTSRLMSMVNDEFTLEEATLRDLVRRAHEKIGSPDAKHDFDDVAYGQDLLQAMSQLSLDNREPRLSARCSLVMTEIGMGTDA